MSMRPDFKNRDFTKKPLQRHETQIQFNPENEDEAPFRAQQHHNKDGCLDTAKIVSRFFQTGLITHTRDATARYIDATVVTDFREAMTINARGRQAFEQLPDAIRKKKFNNDPEEFVKFVLDEANADQLREWGLAEPLKTTEPAKPVEVKIVNPEPSEGENKPA